VWKIFTLSSLVIMKDIGVAAGGWLHFSAFTVTSPILTSLSCWISFSFSVGIAWRSFLADVGSAMTVHCVCFWISETVAWSRWS